MPEQVVVERDAHPNEPFAVIDQQPDVELDAGQLGDRQPVQAFAQRRPGDGDRVDAVGLAAIAAGAALAGHQPRRDANDALAVDEQKPLEGARDVPAVLQRPDPLVAQAARPVQRRGEAASRRPRWSSRRPARRCSRRPRRSCASACACPHRARSWPSSLSPRLKADARRTWLAWGGATLLSSHAGTSPTGDERHSESQSGPTADSLKSESARRRSEPLLEAGRHRPNPNSKPDRSTPLTTASAVHPCKRAVAVERDRAIAGAPFVGRIWAA